MHDDVLQPVLNEDRATWSTNPDCLKSITPKCRTATFQKSFMSRCARVWNVLPKELTGKNTGIACFKSRLYKYYESALKIYDVENPRTSGGASAISEGDIFIYSCSAQLISFEIESTSKQINCAEHEYMNMSPSLIALATLLPRTWKSTSLSCNMSRNLFCSNSCCY